MATRITVSEELRTSSALTAAKRKFVSLQTTSGAISTSTGALRWYNDTGVALTIVSTRASLGTAPAGSTAIFDIKLNGTSIWATTTGNRPTIAIAGNTAQGGTPDTVTIPAGGYVTADVLQVGSGTAGSNLTFGMWVQPASN